ncbi:hypothetical protein [Jannaschia formosa]|uniref:hypothetical protein n=1 Tax=Jannaschia formosa TaxID=2259592 RepID=UPI000E1BE2CE|nr:hypothetical protein [Jannaschia formosa]TFL18533.1 hypothetical protein DR046_08635 [Jannaschia formosa]
MAEPLRRAAWAALVALLLLGPVAAGAQVNLDDLGSLFDAPPSATAEGDRPDPLDPARDAPPVSGPPASQATLDAYDASRQRLYDYHVEALDHRMAVFRWQYRSSMAIFAVVVLIVLIGLYFSWMQFHASDRGRDMGSSSLEASSGGLKVSSPVLGVIILALSLGFFYLYLVHVYPIFEVF